MIRRLALAGLIALFPAIAWAQFATIAATPPNGDSSDRVATTAFVQGAAGGSLALQSGQIFIGSVGNVAVGETVSGDCTLAANGAITCPKANGTAFGTAAFQNTGTSGANVPFLNGNNTWGGTNIFPSPAFTGTVTGNGTIPSAVLVSTAVTAGSYGSSTAIPNFNVNAEGQLTLAGTNVVIAPAGTLSGATLNSTVVSSSLTSVGTLTGGATGAGFTLNFTTSTISGTLGYASGGTNASSQTTARNNIFPTPTRSGDIAYWTGTVWQTLAGNNSGTQFLQETASGVPSWATVAGTGTVTSVTCNGVVITNAGTCPSTVAVVATQTFCLTGLGCTTSVASGGTATYTPRAGLLYAIIECVGSGGGGGGAAGTTADFFSGTGGGGGSYSRAFASAATIGASQTVTLGAHGAGGAAGANAGAAGAAVSLGTLCSGTGGPAGAAGSVAGVPPPGTPAAKGTGNTITALGYGGQAGIYATASNIIVPAGSGGASYFGGGAPPSVINASSATAGVVATNFGAGGSGANAINTAGTAAGGAGAEGIVIVTEYSTQ